MSSERLIYLDNLKGFLIILVVLGHSLQTLMPYFDQNILFRIIYSFHMPLFFFVSGILNFKIALDKPTLQRRFKSLLIPYFFYLILYHYLGKTHLTWKEQLLDPSNGLWFLWILFLCILTTYSFDWLSKKTKIRLEIGLFVGFLVLNLLKIVGGNNFGFGLLAYHYFYFLAVFLYKKHEIWINTYNRYFWLISILLFPLFAFYWTRVGEPLFYSFLNLGSSFVKVYKYITAISGIVFFFGLFKIYIFNELYLFTKIGKVTLGIYFIHFWIIGLLSRYLVHCFGVPLDFLVVGFVFIISLLVSFGLTFIIKKNKYLSTLILG